MKRTPKKPPRLVLVTCALAIFYFTLSFSPARAQECQAALERAEDRYDVGEYEQVIALLTECPPREFREESQKLRAYKLLALAQFRLRRKDDAEASVTDLLQQHRQFKADSTQDPEDFVELVKVIKQRLAAKPGRSKRWLWIGGGGLVAGAVAVFLIFKGDELGTLPEAPDPPR